MTTTLSGTTITYSDGSTQPTVGASGDLVTRIFTAPGTWTKPATTGFGALKFIRVRIWGGGGGGGGSNSYAFAYGGAGGGGGWSQGIVPAPFLPASAITVTVGPGGTAGAAVASTTAGGAGGTGGTTSFGPWLSTTGGAGGSVDVNGYGIGGISGGSAGVTALTPTVADQWRSFGAGSGFYGQTGLYGSLTGSAGSTGTGYGTGGGGGTSGPTPATAAPRFAGGAGAAGLVVVEEFY